MRKRGWGQRGVKDRAHRADSKRPEAVCVCKWQSEACRKGIFGLHALSQKFIMICLMLLSILTMNVSNDLSTWVSCVFVSERAGSNEAFYLGWVWFRAFHPSHFGLLFLVMRKCCFISREAAAAAELRLPQKDIRYRLVVWSNSIFLLSGLF